MSNTIRYTVATVVFLAVVLTADLAQPGQRANHQVTAADATAQFELATDDHICIIGNALAERMQHSGWLETLIHAKFPRHHLVIRNLGYSGDEIAGYTDQPNRNRRLRSMDFGSADQWLAGSAPIPQPAKLSKRDDGKVSANRFERTETRADVVFAFFGYNESFAGEAGLAQFKKDLEAFIKHTRSQKYNGRSSPRLVLFSPIAFENLQDTTLENTGQRNAHLPDGQEHNARLRLYTNAMREIADANATPFVDLFTATFQRYEHARATRRSGSVANPLTTNGVHLTDDGELEVARIIQSALFGGGERGNQSGAEYLGKLRSAVLDKNFHWFNRYRVTDGYSTYGDRAFLKFSEGPGGYGDGLSNYSVGQRELEALDVLTANRDKVVWSAAEGRIIQAEDSNLPEFLAVISNKPGPLPGGKHEFVGGEAEIGKMDLAKGMKVNLFASEEQFPELVNPVQIAFDVRGRLWVAAWRTYPHWRPTESMDDKLLILEDSDGDGRADRCKTFAGDLHNPTGFEFWNGGVLVAQGPDLLFLQDTDGDDHYDLKERVLHGLDTADTHHASNSFTFDPGGALYFQEGTFHHSQVETPWGPPVRLANAGVFRFEPRARKFETYVSFGFANPHGHVWDRWGRDIVHDGTGAQPYHGALFSGRIAFPDKHGRPPQVYQQRTRPCSGTEILSSRHFPPELQDTLLVGNVIGVQGILIYRVSDFESSLVGAEVEPMLLSSDPNFRPTDFEIGADGALYFSDWQNPIIGHMQHNLRDPNRDREHGRVYRVTYEGRPLLAPPKIAGAPIAQLLELLREPENRTRYRTRIELSARPTESVVAETNRWIAALDAKDPNYEHNMLEGLWVFQQHDVVNVDLLDRVLRSPEPRARAAAARVLCYWRDRVPDALARFKSLAADADPRVRLEAVRAASFFNEPEAVEIVLVAADRPTDRYIEFVRGETMRTLDPIWKSAIADGREIRITTEVGARFLLRSVPTDRLLRMERTRPVAIELLFRPGLQDDVRRDALRVIAVIDNKTEPQVLINAIQSIDDRNQNRDDNVLFDLVRLLSNRRAVELSAVRTDLERLATAAKQPIVRQIGFVALITVDASAEKAWAIATQSVAALADFVHAVPLVSDTRLRASLYPTLLPLLDGLPDALADRDDAHARGTLGRFIRIELPGPRRTLTLAEVEVHSAGRNLAPQGTATQINVAHGGDARKAIDGKKSGAFGDGGQTHTHESIRDPWWELDLGQDTPIDSIVVFNRTDGELGKRLDGFNLTVLDSNRSVVFSKTANPTPNPKSEFALEGGAPTTIIRRAAMNAIVSIRGQEAASFQSLARFVRDDVDRLTALRAMQRLPRSSWPREQAKPLIDLLVADVRKIPIADRTAPAALDTLEFADALSTLLPADQAKSVRTELRELGVRVIRIGTLFERMSFDKEIIAVQAGRPVEFVFENTDLMPHNFVITQPGALEEIGQQAEATATDPNAAARQYVPASAKVLLASRLLQPRESEKLSYVVPKQTGVYPYVCTYPGHWRRMFGALYVVDNLDDYLVNPESYLSAHPPAIRDDLLKDRRPRTEWNFDDLAAVATGLAAAPAKSHVAPSFANGKHLFEIASCVACHRLNDVGNEFGPDLAKLDPKFTPTEILRELLEPSARINEKYQTFAFETRAGRIVTGIVLEESTSAVKIIENPLAKSEPIVLKTSDIVERQKLPQSIMPKGLLDKLTRDEIFDLIAYVTARGKPDHTLFRAGSHHEHK